MSDYRKPHVVIDLDSRLRKAEKILRLLDIKHGKRRIRVLDIGTGSGIIAHAFAASSYADFDVHAVDCVDSRVIREGYKFTRVPGIELPFEDNSFDIVVSNHVLEHVGQYSEQVCHLKQIKRVLSAEGLGYIACPSRWMIIEPHYRVPFLSWLPQAARTSYLRLLNKGEYYDCEPPGPGQLEQMLRETGFEFDNLFVPAVRATFDIEQERYSKLHYLTGLLPDSVLKIFSRASPTLIYLVSSGNRKHHQG